MHIYFSVIDCCQFILFPCSTTQDWPAQVAVGVNQSSHRQWTLWVSLSVLHLVAEGMGCLTLWAPRGVQGAGGLADKATLDAPLDVARTLSLCMHQCSQTIPCMAW